MQNDEYFHGTLKYGPCFRLLENKTDKDRKKLELRVCSQQFEAIVFKFSITVIDDILQTQIQTIMHHIADISCKGHKYSSA